ncbi:DUF4386 domain-containing protein [Runella slithyformis]|uniref:DUF4386 domain-containing protein n=1 Tax=Runella slithyformis (strain ATCC 29530 / DSM 19594 / LMG 11500 / NCIMB 11436 / LSU 4) TaxID=761193 RepID=A0A7U3ZP26_RUNSL|nr:DUF4386 domain-containing protein [Runella slithyformis]AEI50750.1 hypothetical protein Runsl_4422 [Runella slithyformis DSM 19594]
MNTYKTIGGLLVAGAIAVFIPYTILTIIFDYPDILRQDTAAILTKFHKGGSPLIWTWFAFAIAGIPLLPAYILLGQRLEHRSPLARIAANVGVIGLIVQMIGLLRWTFVVPLLSDLFVHAPDNATKAAAEVAFKTIHQFGGVLLGEHIGQLFTIAWTVMISFSLTQTGQFAAWVSWLGYGSSLIYFLAQAELLATVMPGLPFWDLSGFLGSTLWLIWLIAVGVVFLKNKDLHGLAVD